MKRLKTLSQEKGAAKRHEEFVDEHGLATSPATVDDDVEQHCGCIQPVVGFIASRHGRQRRGAGSRLTADRGRQQEACEDRSVESLTFTAWLVATESDSDTTWGAEPVKS